MRHFFFLSFLRSDPMSADLSPISLSQQLLRLSDYDSSQSQSQVQDEKQKKLRENEQVQKL
ncbi:unnamed protein product [Arabidopsis halleri]